MSRAALLAELVRVEEALVQRYATERLRFYRPYPRQRDFHAAGRVHRERLFMAGNQLGKCITGQTLIDNPIEPGKPRRVDSIKGRHRVWAWDGQAKQVVWAEQPFRKDEPPQECFRVWMADGRWFECSANHRILTAAGWLPFGCLAEFFPALPASSLECGLLAHVSDVRHWLRKLGGCREHCFVDCHLCDEPLHDVLDTVLAPSPSRADAQRRILLSYRVDAQGRIRTSNRLQDGGRLSSLDVVGRFEGRCVESPDRAPYSDAPPLTLSNLASSPLLAELLSGPQLAVARVLPEFLDASLVYPYNDGNHIIAYQPIGVHDIWDFSVPYYHNYVVAGVVHHNTLSGSMEMAMHLTGEYPDWWEGYRFDRPIVAWAAGVTGESTRDNPQRLLLGRNREWGTGSIPKRAIVGEPTMGRGMPDGVDHARIAYRGNAGWCSTLYFKSYEKGREKWQGDTIDCLWFDEEPGADIYTEGLTRTNATGGPLFITFTPLLGMSEVVRRFLTEENPDRHVTRMTIDDVAHYSDEEKARIIASYPEYEREARVNGVPMLGSGRVYPIAEQVIRCESIALPRHWARIAAIDFGWEHPTAVVWLAWDRDADVVYLTDCYRRAKETPIVHAAAVKARGAWIPLAWPHDGQQTEKGTGKTLASQYREQGLAMLATPAAFHDGGRSVEAGIMDILERMQTGRFQVFAHLADWWEEFRMYHREEGKIVKEHDDLMDATRYAVMMLASARCEEAPKDRYSSGKGRHAGPSWMSR